MELPIRKLFASEKSSEVENKPVTKDEARQEGETYKQYGFRLAGRSEGNELSLQPNLHAIYWGLRKRQEEDENLQNELKLRLAKEKTNLEAEQEQAENDQKRSLEKQEELKQEIAEKKDELIKLKQESYRKNRKAWSALIISGIILVPFTLYFFIFYSSVAYSAFFKQFSLDALASDGSIKLADTIFDAGALSAAWNAGLAELLFILLMPIIFLAFGFILNRWEAEKGKMKYAKIPLIILVAFIFDALLSYEICEKIYNILVLMSPSDMPPYSVRIAAHDPRFWIIICLGFVSYLIWGVTFGYFVKSIDELDLNKVIEQNLKDKIEALKAQRNEECVNYNAIANKIVSIKAKVKNLDLQIDGTARYDLGKIKLELNNFFAGWQQYLSNLGKSEDIKRQAHDIFHNTLVQLKLEQEQTES